MLDALRREDFDRAALIKQQISATEQDVLYPDTKETYVPRYFAQAMDGTWQIKVMYHPLHHLIPMPQRNWASYWRASCPTSALKRGCGLLRYSAHLSHT